MDYNKINILMKLGREYGHQKIRDVGVTDTEHSICTFLFFHDAVSQDTIASALMLDKTTVAKALLRMVEKGLVVRNQNPSNRRKNIISITNAGKQTIGESVEIYDEWLNIICSCFSKEEQLQFNFLLDKLIKNAFIIREK